MIHLLVADDKSFRSTRAEEIIGACGESECITVDDSIMALADLKQFLYPSLFSITTPIVHAKFLLGTGELTAALTKEFSASPTVFLFEELSLPVAIITALKKEGAIVHSEERKKIKQQYDVFAATACITANDKKARWIAYRDAVATQPIEAILGILYWKVRMLATKGAPGNNYEKLYRDMLDAQVRAWRSGAPLEALIEKVLLEQ